MSTVRMILSMLTSMTGRKPVRRRKRIQPSGEQMEPRALLSGLRVAVANLVPPQTAGGALVIRADQAPSFTVTQNHSCHADDVVDQGNVENQDPSGP